MPAFLGPFSSFDARLRLVQSVFDLASIRRYQAARSGVQLAVEQRRLAEQQVITATALAYIGLLQAGESVAAAEANVELARQLLDLATNERDAGIATGLDVARAETRLASQQVQLAQTQNGLDTARLNLLRVIGAPLGGSVSAADVMRFDPQEAPEAAGAIQRALAGRLELAIAFEQVSVARAEFQAATAGWAPSISAFGDYGSSGLKPNEVICQHAAWGSASTCRSSRRAHPGGGAGRNRTVREAEMQLADLRAAVEKDVRQSLDDLANARGTDASRPEKSGPLQRELALAGTASRTAWRTTSRRPARRRPLKTRARSCFEPGPVQRGAPGPVFRAGARGGFHFFGGPRENEVNNETNLRIPNRRRRRRGAAYRASDRKRGGRPRDCSSSPPLRAALLLYSSRGYESTDNAFLEGGVVQVSPRVAGQVVRVLGAGQPARERAATCWRKWIRGTLDARAAEAKGASRSTARVNGAMMNLALTTTVTSAVLTEAGARAEAAREQVAS